MKAWVALLRAVNVGGTGKLEMKSLVEICEAAGLTAVRTYIASGNVVFRSHSNAAQTRRDLEKRLRDLAGTEVKVFVRSAEEMANLVARNPFAGEPASRVVVLFLDGAPPKDTIERVKGLEDERIALGQQEIFVHYPRGMGRSRLRLPGERQGTARNMNTVRKLAEMAADLR